MFKKVLVSFLVLVVNFSLLAHEGHKEAGLKSLYGGVVKKTTNTFVEVVQEGKEVQLFVRDHDDKMIPLTDLQIGGEVKDSKKKSEPLKVAAISNKHFKVLNDVSKHPFFSLKVMISGKIKNTKFAKEEVVFNLENSME